MSKASLAAEAYARKEITRLSQRVVLTAQQYDLLKEMFALAWMEGHMFGVASVSKAMADLLKGLKPPTP